MKPIVFCAALAGALLAVGAQAQSRDHISIVGSSTVFPFSAQVAEHFGKSPGHKTPTVESTGTGGGFKLFCGGVGVQYPDISNASRRIKPSEVEACAKNGVKDIAEVKFGYDGLTIATPKGAPAYKLTRKDLFLALAKQVPDPKNPASIIDNPYQTWNEVDSTLPKVKIAVFGPAPNHGTRDSFNELVMDNGCEQLPTIKAIKESDEARFKKICSQIREDGAWTDVSEDYALIMGKLAGNKHALAAFTFSYLDQNRDKIVGIAVDGVAPSFETIADGSYPVSRPLFFYVKKAHVGVIPGIKEYTAEFLSEKAAGAEGYLADKGLIPLKKAELATARKDSLELNNVQL